MYELVKVNDLTKMYGYNHILKDINLTVYDKDIIYLSGENGAGKSTFLKLMAGLIHPTKGQILYKDDSLFDNYFYRKKVGYMTTESMYYESLTVIDNLRLIGNLYKVKNINNRIEQLIKYFQIDYFSDKKLSEISSGMRRKFQIAASIIHNPQILYWDEPFNTLDEQTINLVKKVMTNYTLIFTSHDQNLSKSICNRHIHLSNGNLKEMSR